MHHSATMPPPDFSVNISEWPAAAQQQRVVIVTGSYAHAIDGVALTLNRLASHLLRSGHEVLVLSPGRRGAPVLRHAGTLVRVPSVPLPIWSEYRLTFGVEADGFRYSCVRKRHREASPAHATHSAACSPP